MGDYKKTELETLSTFQEEIPSIYYSHKGKANSSQSLIKINIC